MTIVNRSGGDKKGIQGDSSGVGYESTARGSLSRALTTATQQMTLLPIEVSVLSPNKGVSDVCLRVDWLMEANTPTGVECILLGSLTRQLPLDQKRSLSGLSLSVHGSN